MKTKSDKAQAFNQLCQGTKVNGNLEVPITLRVDGELIGNVNSTDKVVTGESSLIKGSIHANEVFIGGQFFGGIKANKLLVILASGRIEGDINAPEVCIERGGFFQGNCHMSQLLPMARLAEKHA